jgi:hypothetical protein
MPLSLRYKVLVGVGPFVEEDREHGVCGDPRWEGIPRVRQGEFVGEVVERGAQIMQSVARYGGELPRHGLQEFG